MNHLNNPQSIAGASVTQDVKPSILEDAEIILNISENIISSVYALENTLSPIIDRNTSRDVMSNKPTVDASTVHQKLLKVQSNLNFIGTLITELNRNVSL